MASPRSAAREPGSPAEEEPPARSWRWGELSGAQGTAVIVIAALLGAIVTVATQRDPGTVLGGLVIIGTLAAAFAVRARSAYLLIPVPVLCYLVFALAAGLVRDHASSSSSALTVNAAQWVANGFVTMAAATALAVVITGGRWWWARHTGAAGAGTRGEPDDGRRQEAWDARDRGPDQDDRSRPGNRSGGGRGGQLRGGAAPQPSFRPDPGWSDDRRDRRDRRGQDDVLDQGDRWARGDHTDSWGYGGDGGQAGGGYGRAARRPDPGRGDRGRTGDDWGRGGRDRDVWDRDVWDRGGQDRRSGRGDREPGDQGPGDWRRRPPGPPSFGSFRDLAAGW